MNIKFASHYLCFTSDIILHLYINLFPPGSSKIPLGFFFAIVSSSPKCFPPNPKILSTFLYGPLPPLQRKAYHAIILGLEPKLYTVYRMSTATNQ